MAFNILIADDSETMRAVIKKTVVMSGVPIGEILEAATGREVLDVLKETWVDVILTDINMPEMSGMDLLRELKQDEVYENIPVVMITTESSLARMEQARNLGAAAYIKKPFLPETIKQILMEVLEKAYAHKVENKVFEDGNGVEGDEGMDF
ncbi:MAG: response regulator [Desulfobulbaceae bacterium]|nr:response regulator [Desulfobulbaceae bacterium]MCK5436503.1 response regulator [Desulfobulbaceae bacterium]MCK5543651.1 response regulator [Desulfobulbaceae bacterium]